MKNIYYAESGSRGVFEGHYYIGLKDAKEFIEWKEGWLTPRELDLQESVVEKVGTFNDLYARLFEIHRDKGIAEKAIEYIKANGSDEGFNYY